MIPGLMFVISGLTLLQFFVSYSRSLIAESRVHELSEETREICGLTAFSAPADQFRRLLRLLDLCPEHGENSFEVRAVALYFGLLGLARNVLGWVIPSTAIWIDRERAWCAYAAAVALDRRIAYSRSMMTQLARH